MLKEVVGAMMNNDGDDYDEARFVLADRYMVKAEQC